MRAARLAWVHPRLWLSDLEHAESHVDDYDAVISLLAADQAPRALVRHAQVMLFVIRDAAQGTQRQDARDTHRLSDAASYADSCLQKQQRVLIHCQMGCNRSVAVALALAMRLGRCPSVTRGVSLVRDSKEAAGHRAGDWLTLCNMRFQRLLEAM